MAAISSVQRIGWPVSASTLAAASRALRRLLAASVGGAAGVFRALEALAVLRDVGGFFFWVAMMLLLGDRIRKEASRLPRCLLRTGQLPRRPARDQAQPERNSWVRPHAPASPARPRPAETARPREVVSSRLPPGAGLAGLGRCRGLGFPLWLAGLG